MTVTRRVSLSRRPLTHTHARLSTLRSHSRVESRASTESGVAAPPGAGVGLVRPRSSRLERRRLGPSPLLPWLSILAAHLSSQKYVYT